ncbi:MAG: hypothetical protein WA724_09720 [Candidatus Dormiibacterota bacterium]
MKQLPPGSLLLRLPDPIWRLTLQLALHEGGLASLLAGIIEDRLGASSSSENATARHQAPVS